MAISLYDATVASFIQTVGAAVGFMEKGRAHCAEKGIDLQSVVETRLYPDMLPFHFQAVCIAHHTQGAIEGVQAGEFAPPPSLSLDYAGLQKLVADAHAYLKGLKAEDINVLEGREVIFRLGSNAMPFTAEDFLLTFSMPNLHFHATTAYDILRMQGTSLGKRDYLGALRMKRR
ncbi:MAG: DUF1993 domain-containing protein [Pseudomonadales bacterium]|nr:DUF1993 domain-containing protein [Pseudomonadales bacterium]MCP5184929.1 DUF1993 domain-containing protein [Pseudomonadales bacterium]